MPPSPSPPPPTPPCADASYTGYTVGGAHALRRDDVGSLAVGNPADLVLLADDPFTVAVDRLPDVAVLETWVDGHPAWTLTDGRTS